MTVLAWLKGMTTEKGGSEADLCELFVHNQEAGM
jgi:hypothetical protein